MEAQQPTSPKKGWTMPKFKLPGKLRMPRKSNFTRLGTWATRKKDNMGNAYHKIKADVKHRLYKKGLERNFAKATHNANNKTLKARTRKLAGQAWGATRKHLYNRPRTYIERRMSNRKRKQDLARREEKLLLGKYKVTKAVFTNGEPALTIKLNESLENMAYNEFMKDVKENFGQDFIDAYANRNTYDYNFFNPGTGLMIQPGANIYVFKYTPSIWAQIDTINTFYKSWKAQTVPIRTESLVTHPVSVSGRESIPRRRSRSRTNNSRTSRAPLAEKEPLYYTDDDHVTGYDFYDYAVRIHYTPETNLVPFYLKLDNLDGFKTYIAELNSRYSDIFDITNACEYILNFLANDINTEETVNGMYPAKCTDRNKCVNRAGTIESKLVYLKMAVEQQKTLQTGATPTQ